MCGAVETQTGPMQATMSLTDFTIACICVGVAGIGEVCELKIRNRLEPPQARCANYPKKI